MEELEKRDFCPETPGFKGRLFVVEIKRELSCSHFAYKGSDDENSRGPDFHAISADLNQGDIVPLFGGNHILYIYYIGENIIPDERTEPGVPTVPISAFKDQLADHSRKHKFLGNENQKYKNSTKFTLISCYYFIETRNYLIKQNKSAQNE